MGDAYLNYFLKTFAYADVTASNAPVRKAFDWTRTFQAVPVRNPRSQSLSLDPSDTQTVFSSSRATSISNTTEFAITVSPVDPSIYRFTWTTTGTNPAFRTPRALSLVGQGVVVTRNPNSTATFSSNSLFGAVQVGDAVFVPGVSTGDAAGPFSTLNEGFWVVLAADAQDIVLARPAGVTFTAASESVIVASGLDLQAFSAGGVQVGDQVNISAGFSAPVRRTFTVTAVTPTWFEVVAATPLPEETAVPTTSGIAFYTSAKRYIRVESDQPVAIRVNGATGDEVIVAPFLTGDPDKVGWFELVGLVFSLVLVNKSLQSANVQVFSVE